MHNEDLNVYKQWLEGVIDKNLGKKSLKCKKFEKWSQKEQIETKTL